MLLPLCNTKYSEDKLLTRFLEMYIGCMWVFMYFCVWKLYVEMWGPFAKICYCNNAIPDIVNMKKLLISLDFYLLHEKSWLLKNILEELHFKISPSCQSRQNKKLSSTILPEGLTLHQQCNT